MLNEYAYGCADCNVLKTMTATEGKELLGKLVQNLKKDHPGHTIECKLRLGVGDSSKKATQLLRGIYDK